MNSIWLVTTFVYMSVICIYRFCGRTTDLITRLKIISIKYHNNYLHYDGKITVSLGGSHHQQYSVSFTHIYNNHDVLTLQLIKIKHRQNNRYVYHTDIVAKSKETVILINCWASFNFYVICWTGDQCIKSPH